MGVLNDLAFRTGDPIWATAEDREWLFDRGVNAELDLDAETEDDE